MSNPSLEVIQFLKSNQSAIACFSKINQLDPTDTETIVKLAELYYKVGNYERAMFYFGAACHIVQDLTIPQHAKGKLLDNHRQFELYVKANYKKMKRFASEESPIVLQSIGQYVDYNASLGLDLDYMYRDIDNLTTRFYLTAVKAITIIKH